MELITLEIITPSGVVFNDEVKSVILPGKDGEFGVLPHHASLLTPLVDGVVEVEKKDGSKEILAIAGGIAKVDENKLTALVEGAIYVTGEGDTKIKEALEKMRSLTESIAEGDRILAKTLATAS